MTPQKKKEFFSIPNLLCYVRILLLPIFIVLFVLERDGWTAAVLLLSAATDVVDGFIARKFHMETELGKFLDPLADKLTQAVVSGCLLIRYPIMWVLFLIILSAFFAVLTALSVLYLKKSGVKIFEKL